MLFVAYFFQGTGDEVPSPREFNTLAETVRGFSAFTIETANAIPFETEIDNGLGVKVPVIIDSAYAVLYGPFNDDDDKLIAFMDADKNDGVGLPTDLGEPSARIEFGPRGGIHVRTSENTVGELL